MRHAPKFFVFWILLRMAGAERMTLYATKRLISGRPEHCPYCLFTKASLVKVGPTFW